MYNATMAKEAVKAYEAKKKEAIFALSREIVDNEIAPLIKARATNGNTNACYAVRPDTMHDVMQILTENGFSVEKDVDSYKITIMW